MAEIVPPGGGIEDTLRIRAGSNTAWRPFLIHGQIVPQKQEEMVDALL